MKKYIKCILLIIVLILTLYNGFNYMISIKYTNYSLNKFIRNNTDKRLNNSSEFNLYFFVTPMDCKCLNYFLTDDFIRGIKKIEEKKSFPIDKKSFSINYIVSGDYTKRELEDYISPIKSEINYYIDKNNKAKMFIFNKFSTFKTPFLLILDSSGRVKYWQAFRSNIRIEDICSRLFKLLEAIS